MDSKQIFKVILTATVFCLFITNSLFAEEPLKIGLSLSLSGKYAELGRLQQNGYKLWETKVNQKGGILGRKVRFIIYDDASSASNARKLYKELVVTDKVNFLLGPYSSEITLAVADIANKFHYPMLVPGAAADSIWEKGYRYIFGIWTPASNYVLGFLLLLKLQKVSEIYVVYANDPFSLGIAKGIKKSAAAMGYKLMLFHEIKEGEKNLDSVAVLLKKKKAGVLMVIGHFDEAINMKNALARKHWKPEIFYATVGPTLPQYRKELGSDSENTFSSSNWEPETILNLPGSKGFIKAYERQYKQAPNYHAATAYAACELLEAAIKIAKSFDKIKVRNVLSILNMNTLIGRYGVDRNTGKQICHFPLIIQWQQGQKLIVWPKSLRTATPVF